MTTQKLLRKFGALQHAYGEGDDDGKTVTPPDGQFTQEDVNRMLAEDRRKNETKWQKQITGLTDQMTTLKETKTTEAQSQFEEQLEGMRKQFLTKEQRLKEDSDKQAKERTTTITNLEKDRDVWKGKYSNTLIDNELQAAATSGKHKPVNPNVVVDLLRHKTKLEPLLDDNGSPTGELAPKVEMQSIHDGKPTTLSLTPAEAIERMATDTANYGSLFSTTETGGFNTGNTNNKVITSQEDYETFRESGQHRNIGA